MWVTRAFLYMLILWPFSMWIVLCVIWVFGAQELTIPMMVTAGWQLNRESFVATGS